MSASKQQVFETVPLFLGMLLLGSLVAVPGPTLVDLSEQVGVSSGRLTSMFTVRGAGAMVGWFLGGIVFNRLSRRLSIALILVGASISLITVSLVHSYVLVLVFMLFLGFFCGATDSVLHLRALDVWTSDGALFIRSLSFLFNFGAFLSILIVEPLLSTTSGENFNSNSAVSMKNPTGPKRSSTAKHYEHNSKIITPFTILAVLSLLTAIYYLFYMSMNKNSFENSVERRFKCLFSSRQKLVVFVAVACVLILVLSGNELCYGYLLTAFAVEGSFSLCKPSAVFLTSLYWGCRAVVRFVAIFSITKLRPFVTLSVSLILMFFGSCLLLVSLHVGVSEGLWAGTAIVGLATASCHSSVIMWIGEYVDVTGMVEGVLMIGSIFGELVLPVTTGQLMDTGIKDALIYVFLIATCLGSVLLISLNIMSRHWTHSDDGTKGEDIFCIDQEDTNIHVTSSEAQL